MMKKAQGFTLLEVLLAVTITGLVLGSLFTLLASSKQLAWRTADNLYETIKMRQAVNIALTTGDIPLEKDEEEQVFNQNELVYQHVEGKTLESNSEFNKVLPYALQHYQIQLPQAHDVLIKGVRFHVFKLSETKGLGQ